MTAPVPIGSLDACPRPLRRAGRLALLAPATAPPGPARGVARPRLAGLLSGSAAPQMTVLVAPAGYGKTTLLWEWAAADERPFAWVALDPADNDPGWLEASVALAVQRVDAEPRT